MTERRTARRPTALWLIAVVIGLMLAGHGTAGAADQITIAVMPSSITPALEGATTAAVLTTNNTSVPVTVRLSMDPNGLIEPHNFGAARTIPANGTISWELPIRRIPGSAAPNAVLIRAAYSVKGSAGELTTALAVPLTLPPGAFDIGKATMAAGDSAIRVDDVHDSQFAVRISNPSQQRVAVDSLRWTFPPYLQVTLADTVTVPFEVPPNGSTSVAFTVRGVGALERGSNQIMLTAGLSWDSQHGNLVTEQPVDVGAFGESQIGELLAIPTLLVLPGAVVLALLAVRWALGVRPVARSTSLDFPVSGALQFGVAMLLLSALAIFLDGVITGRSLLAGYGSRDILVVVVVFAVAAVGIYLAVCGFCLYRRWKQRTDAKKVQAAEAITPDMPPGEVLARLAVRQSDLWMARAMQRTGASQRMVLLPNDDRPDEPTLVCVPIEVRLAKAEDRPSMASQRLEQALCMSLRPGRPAAETTALLTEAGADADAGWRPARGLKGVEEADKASLEPLPGKAPLVYLA